MLLGTIEVSVEADVVDVTTGVALVTIEPRGGAIETDALLMTMGAGGGTAVNNAGTSAELSLAAKVCPGVAAAAARDFPLTTFVLAGVLLDVIMAFV